jgi:exodeoxyribonuclease VII small subunit
MVGYGARRKTEGRTRCPVTEDKWEHAGAADAPSARGGTLEEPSLEARLRRLEEIVGELETEELGLDRALALFEEGVGLVKEAEEALAGAELRVEELLGEGSELRKRLLEEEEG